jgi:hypothetical protein
MRADCTITPLQTLRRTITQTAKTATMPIRTLTPLMFRITRMRITTPKKQATFAQRQLAR